MDRQKGEESEETSSLQKLITAFPQTAIPFGLRGRIDGFQCPSYSGQSLSHPLTTRKSSVALVQIPRTLALGVLRPILGLIETLEVRFLFF